MSNQQSMGWSLANKDVGYFIRQLDNPYQSTISFFDFLDAHNLISEDSTIIDACCGSGCNTFYASERFSPKKLIGFDYQEEFLTLARDYKIEKFNADSISGTDIFFYKGDIYDVDGVRQKLRDECGEDIKVDGIIFIQTLLCMTDWKKSLSQLGSFNSKWIAISSLFYEGLIEAEITIKQFSSENKDPQSSLYDVSPYNIHSMVVVEDFLRGLGFKRFHWKEFEIKTPLEKPRDKDKMGTYTIETSSGKLIQASGPIMMPWHILIAER
mmetsp:Transcript_97976/g.238392  ORF Transcript_97976/g.238392 Transcript_97976/m.238392 type:complete len:268 (+) Transcript_97976:66-869(+)